MNKTLTAGEIVDLLRNYPQDTPVYFSSGGSGAFPDSVILHDVYGLGTAPIKRGQMSDVESFPRIHPDGDLAIIFS